MPNPYDPAELTRQAQQRQLSGETSNTMPVGGARRDQWSGAGDVARRDGRHAIEGFDAANMADSVGMNTAKYQNGRIFESYDPNGPDALGSVLGDAEFKRLFPNAKGVGPDKIDYGDGRPVDVIRGHGAPGAAWAFQTEDAPTDATAQSPQAMTPAAMTTDNSAVAKIMEELAAAQNGSQSPTEREALMALLQQEAI